MGHHHVGGPDPGGNWQGFKHQTYTDDGANWLMPYPLILRYQTSPQKPDCLVGEIWGNQINQIADGSLQHTTFLGFPWCVFWFGTLSCTPWEVDSWYVRYWVHLLPENQPDFFRKTASREHIWAISFDWNRYIEFFRKRPLKLTFVYKTPIANNAKKRRSTLIFLRQSNVDWR